MNPGDTASLSPWLGPGRPAAQMKSCAARPVEPGRDLYLTALKGRADELSSRSRLKRLSPETTKARRANRAEAKNGARLITT